MMAEFICYGKTSLTDRLELRKRKISVCTELEPQADFCPNQNNSHLGSGEPHLGSNLSREACSFSGLTSSQKSRPIHKLCYPTCPGSRGLCGKAVEQPAESWPVLRKPVLGLCYKHRISLKSEISRESQSNLKHKQQRLANR